MKPKTKERVCLAIIVVAMAMAVWTISKVLMADGGWLYDHTKLICTVAGATIGLVLIAIAVMWNYDKPAVKVIAASALVATTLATTLATSAQAGIFTPAGGDSANQGKRFWWDFGFGDFLDGMASWISGSPTITVNPNPPSNSDTSGK